MSDDGEAAKDVLHTRRPVLTLITRAVAEKPVVPQPPPIGALRPMPAPPLRPQLKPPIPTDMPEAIGAEVAAGASDKTKTVWAPMAVALAAN